jgi:hypothetical protein
LSKEAKLLSSGKCPAWIPKAQNGKRAVKNQYPVSKATVLNMSTLADMKSEVDIIHSRVDMVSREKRGPKHKTLPIEVIMQWASEGMGSKAIAARLNRDAIQISYKTIQRLLSGQRILV